MLRGFVPYVTSPPQPPPGSVYEDSTLVGSLAAVVSVDAMWVDVTIVGLPLSCQAYECIPLRK